MWLLKWERTHELYHNITICCLNHDINILTCSTTLNNRVENLHGCCFVSSTWGIWKWQLYVNNDNNIDQIKLTFIKNSQIKVTEINLLTELTQSKDWHQVYVTDKSDILLDEKDTAAFFVVDVVVLFKRVYATLNRAGTFSIMSLKCWKDSYKQTTNMNWCCQRPDEQHIQSLLVWNTHSWNQDCPHFCSSLANICLPLHHRLIWLHSAQPERPSSKARPPLCD